MKISSPRFTHRLRSIASTLLLIVCCIGQPACTQNQDAAGLTLAQNNKALMPVLISDKASASTKSTAVELAGYLTRITGAQFDVKTAAANTTATPRSAIVLGTISEFPNPGLEQALEIRNLYDGKEAFAIRTETAPNEQRLLLIAADDRGVSHAAFRFLEHIGYRHFFPAPEWEIVPSIPTLRVSLNEDNRPNILSRSIWYGYGLFADPGLPRAQWRSGIDSSAWVRHNRMGSSFTVSAGHVWQAIIAGNKAIFAEHPEYLALVKQKDGTMARRGPQLCVSNVGLRQVAIDYAFDYFKSRPNSEMVSMEPADGEGACQCDVCKALGPVTNQGFFLANEVARAVHKQHPGKMVGILAYNWHSEPPTFDLEPNVYVQLTAGFTVGQYTYEELLDLWPKKTTNLGFYDYYSVWAWDRDRLPGGRGGNIAYLRKSINEYSDRKATSISAESGNNWGPHGRGYYIASRLMWNPKADVDALLADFYEKAFGAGAPAMKRYYERLDPGNEPLQGRNLLALAFRDVDEASRLTQKNAEIQARLNHLKQYLRYIHLRWMLDNTPDKAHKKELTLAALTHVYRTRYSYMNHWEAMRNGWASQAAVDFAEPTWMPNTTSPKPWENNAPVTAEETEAEFQDGLEYFQPEPVTEISFSKDLVPVVFEGSTPVVTNHHYQGKLRYLLYSVRGEPLDIEIVAGTIAWYRDRAPARYTLLDSNEKKVQEGRLPLDGQPHPLHLKVPGPGLYAFDFDDSTAAWRIKAAADRSIVLPLRRGSKYSNQSQLQMYFYVPKGTTQIEYLWTGGAHKVVGPDKKVVQEVKTSGTSVIVPVPDGMDGKVWSLSSIVLGHLWFYNIPNYLAASPNALLLPREVVEKDELTVRR